MGRVVILTPGTEALIECRGVTKHIPHVCDAQDVPVGDWFIECRGPKHILHVCDSRGVPVSDWLIECLGEKKHGVHVCDSRGVPVGDWLIEYLGGMKHVLHVLTAGVFQPAIG